MPTYPIVNSPHLHAQARSPQYRRNIAARRRRFVIIRYASATSLSGSFVSFFTCSLRPRRRASIAEYPHVGEARSQRRRRRRRPRENSSGGRLTEAALRKADGRARCQSREAPRIPRRSARGRHGKCVLIALCQLPLPLPSVLLTAT